MGNGAQSPQHLLLDNWTAAVLAPTRTCSFAQTNPSPTIALASQSDHELFDLALLLGIFEPSPQNRPNSKHCLNFTNDFNKIHIRRPKHYPRAPARCIMEYFATRSWDTEMSINAQLPRPERFAVKFAVVACRSKGSRHATRTM